jgi:DNA-binding NarL/FixJ family response regulator
MAMVHSLVGSAPAILVAVDVDDETVWKRLEREVLEQRTAIVLSEFDEGHDCDVLITTRLPASVAMPTIFLSDDPTTLSVLPRSSNLRGVLPINIESRELHAAIGAVVEGLAVMSADTFQWLMEIEPYAGQDASNQSNFEPLLTGRERQVLALLADGGSNKHIARSLGISIHTVKFHVSALMSKLRARSRADIVGIGLRRGLIAL